MFKSLSVIALGALSLLAGSATFAEEDDEGQDEGRFEKTIPADPKGTVLVKNVAGEVRVVGSTRNEIEIEATYEEGVERIDVVSERGRTRIEVVLPKRSDKRRHHRNGDAHLEIRVPQGSELEVQTVSAEIEVRDVIGRQRLRSVSGNVETDLEQSDMQLETVSGDVLIRGRGKPTNLRARTVSGNLTLTRAAGDIDATTTSGDLILEVDPAKDIRVRTTSGNLRLSGDLAPDGEVEADTVSGELSVRLRSPGFRYDVSTFSGDIDTCLGQKPVRESEYGPGMLLNGVHGNGKGEVRLKTMSGDVEICPK